MCVIIYVPKESSISLDEIRNAWNTNPDGAGYSIQKDGNVVFKRGFMKLESFIEEIKPLIGVYNLLLHFRISTSKAVNKVQTHPYKKGNVSLTQGNTKRPVICMNGIITGQKEYKDCNDTMSYIVDHTDAFSVINQDILNIIESDTGAKWAVMLPNDVLLSSKFKYQNGRYYSNTNHLWRNKVIYVKKPKTEKTFENLISQNLRKEIKKYNELYEDTLDFIDIWCNYGYNGGLCNICTKCLKHAKTIRDIKITLNENYYASELYDNEEEELFTYDYAEDSLCCSTDLYNYEDEYTWWYEWEKQQNEKTNYLE